MVVSMSGPEKVELELMVWGYACKLFRDDEKALHIDSGKHLIPWMGEDKLMIDRYDGRGALYDLASYEPQSADWDSLSQDEKDVEAKCDVERYRSLFEEEETRMYREEENKRSTMEYGQVAYSYEEGAVATCQPPSENKSGKAFEAPPGLQLPPDLVRPDTMKQHAIIVKTAGFIAQQGSQMEILMRLKQQGNRKFDFLTHGDSLHDYYKLLLGLIKSGEYRPSEADTSCLDEEEPDGSEGDAAYLHPSLVTSGSHRPDPTNPPPLTKLIVSKIIKYIVKNGIVFEEAIKKLEDPRFSFLDSSDPYYNYYREQVTKSFKIDEASMSRDEVADKSEEEDEKQSDEDGSRRGVKRKLQPVCFSLKKPKDTESLEVSTALPQEDSSEDEAVEELILQPPQPPPPPRISNSREREREREPPVHHLQKERKAKVAQFLKGLKHK